MKKIALGFSVLYIALITNCGYNSAPTTDFFKDEKVYKIIPEEYYNPKNISAAVKLMPIDTKSGFIHISFGNQVRKVLKKFFAKSGKALVLELDQNALAANGLELRKEQNKPGGEFFPHLYGNQHIPQNAVIAVFKVKEDADGNWVVIK